MAVLNYAALQAAASAALGDVSTRLDNLLDAKQLNAEVVQLVTTLKADVDADQAEIDAATEA